MQRRIFITGVTRGLGLALAQSCLRKGDRVFGSFRAGSVQENIQQLCRQWPERFTPIQLDVRNPERIHALPMQLAEELDALDVLINNAGIHSRSREIQENQQNLEFGQLEMSGMVSMFQTNALGPMMLIQALTPLLALGERPMVLNISSRKGSLNNKQEGGNYGYCASKAALNMITRAAAADLHERGIIVSAIHPGVLTTDMGSLSAPLQAKDAAEAIVGLLNSLGLADSGRFLNWDGSIHPW